MKLGQVLALGAGAALVYGMAEAWRPVVRRFEVRLQDLPAQAEGLRIVQISDLHAGALTPPWHIRHLVRLCNAEKPDLIALTGDFITRRNSYMPGIGVRQLARPEEDYAAGLARDLAALHAPLGVFAVPGNHDGLQRSFDAVGERLTEAGIRVLLNEPLLLESGLWLIGIDDIRGGNVDYSAALRDVPLQAPQLILSHNPRAAWMLAQRNALILSGHTHGGQANLPGNVLSKLPVDTNRNTWVRGFYQLAAAQLFVSTGAGTIAVPLRYGVPAEIVVFTLRGQ